MTFSFLNAALLIGLIAVAIPPLIHLLNRRRHDVVDWGAMQFLEISEVTRRRLLIEELILMLMRMALIAILVMAIAGPFLKGVDWMPQVSRDNRDVVLIVDGSASMTFEKDGKTTQEKAEQWIKDFLEKMQPGDGVALLQAREQTVEIVPNLTSDTEQLKKQIKQLPKPAGSANWAKAITKAKEILKNGRAKRDIVILSDGQRYSWADESSLLRWEDLGTQRDADEQLEPELYAVNLQPDRPEQLANWTLSPMKATRAVVAQNQEVTFSTAILLNGSRQYSAPYELRLEVDGKEIKKIKAPTSIDVQSQQVPLRFDYRFTKLGSHLVSLIMEPDPPKHLRPDGYVVKDHLALDNRQDLAVEVIDALPVLIIDGDPTPNPPHRGAEFIRDALAPKSDPSPVVQAHMIGISEFEPEMLSTDLPVDPEKRDLRLPANAKPRDRRPRVLILHNIKQLTNEQRDGITEFLKDGGGVLLTLGQRVDPTHYNDKLYREGRGWMPARVDSIQGDAVDLKDAARPVASSFFHPALEMFRNMRFGGLDNVWLSQWWKVTVPGRKEAGAPIAMLNKLGTPWLVERLYEEGRVLISVVPMDNSWRTNLTNSPAFVPLTHELVYYLAGARAASYNLQPGQPLRFQLPSDADAEGLDLTSPSGVKKPLKVDEALNNEHYVASIIRKPQYSMLIHEGMREAGIWKMTTPDEQEFYYVVQPDRREADLTPTSEEDQEAIKQYVPIKYQNDVETLVKEMAESNELELWWIFLLGIILFLCMEVWLTRRIVNNRAT